MLLKSLLIITLLMPLTSMAETRDTKETTTFNESKQVEVYGKGDYSHDRGDYGSSNFRLRDGDTHTINVEPGDTLTKEQSTLSE